MLAPKKVKFRKWQKGRLRGLASRGASIAFGDIGLKAVQHGQLSSQQIEAARIAMMRHIKRGGKVWIRVFPDRPVTAKPLETRQGSGKGAPVGWCGRACSRAAKKNEKAAMATAAELRDMSVEELRAKLAEQREELMTARFKHATAQLEKTSELKAMRRQVARISTVLTEKE